MWNLCFRSVKPVAGPTADGFGLARRCEPIAEAVPERDDEFGGGKGEPHIYCSSPTSNRHFCHDCGSPLFFERHTRSLSAIIVGSLDDPNIFKPEMHVCLESAMTWLNVHDDVPRYSQKPEGMMPLIDYNPVTGSIEV